MSAAGRAGSARVRVHVSSILHEYTGGASEIEAVGRTLGAVLDDLERRHRGLRFRIVDEQDRLRPHIKVFVDGRAVRALTTPLPAGCELHVLQALSGG